ncbi:Crp/Fnr family transcriptional regulator [Mucilaginibacter sp. UR6-11]|uniref:Crp/Fnr family transcriptional regulator n=1 Tax=Mucilaginibacter sp. UR6-11 TaxID=1435644 RepID=UPI001E45E1C6|nr:Crp/Fnr family transcriptional regulator [Mucilaginibacter sp. UR6-11]MCC8423492.1 Crp/Fnr family transcriptional regulator [Mucilaginibacter sp. UR6-11]
MDTNIFLRHLRSYVDVPDADFGEFLKLLVPLTLKKGDHFYRAGEIPRYSPFILQGCLRQYILDESGREQIILFNEEGNWAGQIGSMRSRLPTNVYLQALEPCQILGITIEHVDLGMERFPWYQRYFLKKYPTDHARLLEQANRLKTEPPEVLYRELMETRPSLLLRIPQHYIANYLGVRTETISRIKTRLVRS